MNLPDYRAAVRRAQMRFENTVREAAETLSKDLLAADGQFFEEQDKSPMEAERDEFVEAMERRRR